MALLKYLVSLTKRSTRKPIVTSDGVVIELVADGSASGPVLKKWHSPAGVCPNPGHEEAEGQTVGVREAFCVGGEQFRFPGDSQLAANKDRAVRCRCYLDFFVRLPGGTEVILTRGTVPPRYEPGRLSPTSVVTLNGKSKGRIILGDLSKASFRQIGGTLEVHRNREILGRVRLEKGKPVDLFVASSVPPAADVAGFLIRTVTHNWSRIGK